jgi:hypothetical protein
LIILPVSDPTVVLRDTGTPNGTLYSSRNAVSELMRDGEYSA